MPEMGLAEAREAIEAAAVAFKTWSRTTAKVRPLIRVPETSNHLFQERHDILKKFYALMQEHAEDLSRLIVSRL